MRRFIFLFLGSIVLVAFFISQHEETETPLPVKLEKAMNVTSMNVYRNEFYGYTVYYPSFFEQVPDSLINETGCCQFRFWNKEEIVQISRKIGTFETSILPYEDCCTVFTPKHPLTRPKKFKVEEAEKVLDVDALVEKALAGVECVTL